MHGKATYRNAITLSTRQVRGNVTVVERSFTDTTPSDNEKIQFTCYTLYPTPVSYTHLDVYKRQRVL